MKTIKIIIVALSLFFSGQTFASGDSDLKDVLNGVIDGYDDAPALRGNLIGGDPAPTPADDPTVPVSDGLYVLFALAGIYGIYMFTRKKREVF